MLTPLEIAVVLIAAVTLALLGVFEHLNERDQRAAAEDPHRRR